MKLFKFIFELSKEESTTILSNLSQEKIDFMKKVYFEMDYSEFFDENGFEGLFCIVNEEIFNTLCKFFNNEKIKFSCIDLSDQILLGKKIKTDYEENNGWNQTHIVNLINKYYECCATSDSVLDKINECGIESLTEFDKEVLAKR